VSPARGKRPPLGQHFLFDPQILRRIVDALDPQPGEVVLEIGPGKGTLTRELLARGLNVVAVEKDKRLAKECGARSAEWGADHLRIVPGDALRLNWHDLLEPTRTAPHSALPTPRFLLRTPHFKVVGNIPYAITTPLIDKALTPPLPQRVVFLVQAEVADRVTARPGTGAYGALTVGVQSQCAATRLFTVRRGAFTPPPRVESAVIVLVPLTTPLVAPEEAGEFRRFVTACFGFRRKQLRGVLRGVTGAEPGAVDAGIAELGLDPRARPETLGVADFVRLLRWRRQL